MDYTPWNRSEPNEYGEGEDCGALNWADEHKWNDVPCDIELGVLCELPSAADPPTK